MKSVTGDSLAKEDGDPDHTEASEEPRIPKLKLNTEDEEKRGSQSRASILMSQVEQAPKKSKFMLVDPNFGGSTVLNSYNNFHKSRHHSETEHLPQYIHYFNVAIVAERDFIICLSGIKSDELILPTIQAELQTNLEKSKTFKKNANKVKLIRSRLVGKTWLLIFNHDGMLIQGKLKSVS